MRAARFRVVLAAAHADFRQRVRSYRFFVVLVLSLLACAYMLPAPGAGYVVMQLGEGRGRFGSAWIGLVFGAIGALILPLIGFYLVKDSVQRDRTTRVGALLATTVLSRLGYVSAKFLSNAAVFGVILGVALLVAPVLQWWRAEDTGIQPLVIAAHMLLIAAPSLLLVAAIAVLFECVPWLRGAFGNIAFFMLWSATLPLVLARPGQIAEGATGPMLEARADLFGLTTPLADFERRLDAAVPGHARTFAIGINIGREIKHRIEWPGVLDDRGWIAARLLWCLACLPLLWLAAACFDRFDPARGPQRALPAAAPGPAASAAVVAPVAWRPLSRLPAHGRARWRPVALLGAELRLLLKGQAWWWYGAALGFWIAGSAVPLPGAVRYLIPMAWFWALARWSQHGARARMHGATALFAAAPAPAWRQLPMQWLAAVLMGLLLVAPVLLRLWAGGDAQALAQALVGAAFVAALAMACGAFSGGPRLFELLFLLLAYASVQQVPGTAFGGVVGLDFAASPAPVYAALAGLLLLLTGVRRSDWLRG